MQSAAGVFLELCICFDIKTKVGEREAAPGSFPKEEDSTTDGKLVKTCTFTPLKNFNKWFASH